MAGFELVAVSSDGREVISDSVISSGVMERLSNAKLEQELYDSWKNSTADADPNVFPQGVDSWEVVGAYSDDTEYACPFTVDTNKPDNDCLKDAIESLVTQMRK